MELLYKAIQCLVILSLGCLAVLLIAWGEYYVGVPAIYVLVPNMFIGVGIGLLCAFKCIKIIEG